ncbi:MAG: MFS transporter [Methanomicrobiales archaeon]|nr:MFS transporter [Methanomicrobiales archaeon]
MARNEFTRIHLLMLCIMAFFAMAAGTLLAPVLPEMVEPLHTTSTEVSLLMSVLTISIAVFTLVIGHFIDRVHRKTLLVPCLVIYGMTGLACFFVSDLVLLCALRFIQGFGVAGMMTLALLIIGDVYHGNESLRPVSMISMSFAIGAISVPLIGGYLALIGWNWPFLFYALALPFAVAVLVWLPETGTKNLTWEHTGIGSAFTALKDLRVAYTVFLGFTVYFLLFAMAVWVPFMLKGTFGFTSGESGLALALEGIAVVFMASRVGPLAGRYSVPIVITGGLAIVGVSLAFMASVPSVITILLMLILFGAGYALAQVSVDVLIIQVSSTESRGGVLSLHTCAKYTGSSLAPVILGIVLVVYGLNAVFILAGFFGLIIALLTYAMRERFRSERKVQTG